MYSEVCYKYSMMLHKMICEKYLNIYNKYLINYVRRFLIVFFFDNRGILNLSWWKEVGIFLFETYLLKIQLKYYIE